ncbi:MAG: redoxin domain-containing protein [Thermoleophilaceae bacterium]|nr:redoxin domain-containing protein [Thermoleophilaceae bacterium]
MNTFWKVVVALLAIGVVVSLFTLFNGSRPVGSENLIGKPLPDFAAPLASGTQEADANVFTPEQAKAVKSTAACDVDLPGAFNSCRDLTGEAILSFWNTTKSECVSDIATLNAFAAAHPDVNTAAVAFDESESQVRKFMRSKDWKLPVPIDRDGAVAALYSVAGCPSTYFVRDGEITGVKLGVLSAAQLEKGLKTDSGATGSTN